jgi:hypothetical protein
MASRTDWRCALELDAARQPVAGSTTALAAAIRRAADLRVYTEFRHNEHIDVTSPNPELIQEVSEFGVTYLLDDAWVAGAMTLRQPVQLPSGFGPRPSLSFFLYNQDGRQAIARPYLDGPIPPGRPGPAVPEAPPGMPKYQTLDSWDADTNAPSSNFVYAFGAYRYCVAETWREVLAHDADGRVTAGSLLALTTAFARGCEVKVAIRGLCADLLPPATPVPEHETFIQCGPLYYYTDQRLLIAETHPLVRVAPRLPMCYRSGEWDFGWVVLRTDGEVVYRCCDPYRLTFRDRGLRCALRWFVRGDADGSV